MKILIVASSLFLMMQNLFAANLLGSRAKANPDQLPYSNCSFDFEEISVALLYGRGCAVGSVTLECTSYPLKGAPGGLKFSIPLKLQKLEKYGLTLGLFGHHFCEIHGLDTKLLNVLFGKYIGVEFAIPFPPMALRYAYHENGISIDAGGVGFQSLAGFSYKLSLPDSLSYKMCMDNSLLIEDTTTVRDEEYCRKLILSHAEKELPPRAKTKVPFDYSKLANFQFQKIRSNPIIQ